MKNSSKKYALLVSFLAFSTTLIPAQPTIEERLAIIEARLAAIEAHEGTQATLPVARSIPTLPRPIQTHEETSRSENQNPNIAHVSQSSRRVDSAPRRTNLENTDFSPPCSETTFFIGCLAFLIATVYFDIPVPFGPPTRRFLAEKAESARLAALALEADTLVTKAELAGLVQ